MSSTTRAACITVAIVFGLGTAMAQQQLIQMVTVVGCLQQVSGDLPWMLEKATEGTPSETAFTSQDEVDESQDRALGTLEYRLLGVGEFDIEPHVGHKVQAKGLEVTLDGERRLNITSFQHLAPACE